MDMRSERPRGVCYVRAGTYEQTAPDTPSEQPRVYGYIRASTDKQVASPESQREIIDEYARRLGRTVDAFYVDPATSGKKPLFERVAGKELAALIRRCDHVIVARLDRLSRSFVGFAHVLDAWVMLKVVLHLCDMPGGVFDPENPMSEMMIGILIVFANDERRLISQRTWEGLAARRQRGERYCRWAEYGWRWEVRGRVTVQIPEPYEQQLCLKAAEIDGRCFRQLAWVSVRGPRPRPNRGLTRGRWLGSVRRHPRFPRIPYIRDVR